MTPSSTPYFVRQELHTRGKTKGSIHDYLQMHHKFIDFTGRKESYTRRDFVASLTHLRERGLSSSSMPSNYSWLKRMLIVFDQAFAFTEGDVAPGSPLLQPCASYQEMGQVTRYAKEGGGAQEVVFWTLASTYGLIGRYVIEAEPKEKGGKTLCSAQDTWWSSYGSSMSTRMKSGYPAL